MIGLVKMINYEKDHALGLLVRSHLLNQGLEVVANDKHFAMTDKERIMVIKHHVENINSIMGVANENTTELATSLYNHYSGQTYKNFPKMRKPTAVNVNVVQYVHTSTFKSTHDWNIHKIYISVYVKAKLDKQDIESINNVIDFFLHRPFDERKLMKMIAETLNMYYSAEKVMIQVM